MRIHKKSTRILDKHDRHILRILQQEARISMKDLGEKVGLSVTPCIERVKRMERDGVIAGYHARLDPAALGCKLLMFVEITLDRQSVQALEQFRHALLGMPAVQECHLISGDFDYLVKARIGDITQHRALLDAILAQLPGQAQTKSYVVMEEVKETLALPTDGPR